MKITRFFLRCLICFSLSAAISCAPSVTRPPQSRPTIGQDLQTTAMKAERITDLQVRLESSPPGANVYAAESRMLLGKTPFQMSVGYLERRVGSDRSINCHGNLGGKFDWSLGGSHFSGGAETDLEWRGCPPDQYLAINPPYTVYFRIEADGYLPVDEKVSFTHFKTPAQIINVTLQRK